MDIRNFFSKTSSDKAKGTVSPIKNSKSKMSSSTSPGVYLKQKTVASKKKSKRIISDVEDEDEIILVKPPKKHKTLTIESDEEQVLETSSSDQSKNKENSAKTKQPSVREVNPSDFFGDTMIQRKKKTPSDAAPKKSSNKVPVSTFVDSDSMDAFLMEIPDSVEKKPDTVSLSNFVTKPTIKEEISEPVDTKPFEKKSFDSPKKQPSNESKAAAPGSSAKSQYASYLHREAPKLLGTRPPPQGAPNCLEGLVFVITGELETLSRDDATNLVRKYGGKATSSVSRNTSYVVVGRDAGAKKLELIAKHGTKQLSEEEFYSFIESRPAKVSKYETSLPATTPTVSSVQRETDSKAFFVRPEDDKKDGVKQGNSMASSSASFPLPKSALKSSVGPVETELFVDKYRPKSLDDLIGNKAVILRLKKWLQSWDACNLKGSSSAASSKSSKTYRGGSDEGYEFKAALLSGSPGIGKTSAALLVCQELGFDPIEFNASDTRSKLSLKNNIAGCLGSHSVREYFQQGLEKNKAKHPGKPCLIMDEIDGMSAGDRGGLAELVILIKTTKIPIICMCNDHSNPKMRTITNYCFDLKFQRPQVRQIMEKFMTIASKENIRIDPPAMEQIILTANSDLRQALNLLYMWKLVPKQKISFDDVHSKFQDCQKNAKFSPFDIVQRYLSGKDMSNFSFSDKMDLYFHDSDLIPLMMHENYPLVTPRAVLDPS
eukprot:Sdes_comp18309_c0_seq1m8020